MSLAHLNPNKIKFAGLGGDSFSEREQDVCPNGSEYATDLGCKAISPERSK